MKTLIGDFLRRDRRIDHYRPPGITGLTGLTGPTGFTDLTDLTGQIQTAFSSRSS